MRKIKFIALLFLIIPSLQPFAQESTKLPSGKKFHIQSALNFGKNSGGCWDVPGYPETVQKGSNIQVYDMDKGHDQTFSFLSPTTHGYYEIQIGNTSISRIDIEGAGTANGTSIKTWEKNGKGNQKFLFRHMGNGRFKIYERNSGKIICLANRSSNNRSNVHIWNDHNGAWAEWYLIDVATKKPYIPKEAAKVQPTNQNLGENITNHPEASEKFDNYIKSDTLTSKRLAFKQGYMDVFSAEPYTFNRIINQKPKLDPNTYDASGAIIIDETTQEIFWNKQNNQNTGTSAKILFYISANRYPEIEHNTNLYELPTNLKNKVWSILNGSIKANPPQLQISEISHPQVNYTKINNYYVAHGVSTAKSDVDLIISSYVIFLNNNEVFHLKVTMANDERRKTLEDLVAKMLMSITFN